MSNLPPINRETSEYFGELMIKCCSLYDSLLGSIVLQRNQPPSKVDQFTERLGYLVFLVPRLLSCSLKKLYIVFIIKLFS